MNASSEIRKATRIEVEILVQMNHCSLIRHLDREFVVDRADLATKMSIAKAA